MDPRRLNDAQRIVGAAGGILTLFAPILMQPHATTWDLIKACLIALLGAFLTFLSGLSTRGPGMEYKEVTEAKVKASLVPPALTVAPSPVEPPPQ